MAGALVGVPDNGEIWLTPTNLQWIMACGLPVVLLMSTPAATFVRIQQVVFLILSGLSGPFIILAAPLWALHLWRGWRRREAFPVLLAGLAAALAAVQAAVLMSSHVMQAAGGLVEAMAGVAKLSRPEMIGAVLVGATALLAFLAISLWPRPYRVQRIGFIFFSAAVLLSTAMKFGAEFGGFSPLHVGDRYFYVPIVMTAFGMITLLFLRRSPSIRLAPTAGLVTVAISAVLTPPFQRLPNDSIEQWRSVADQIGERAVSVTVPPDWTVEIPPR
jgi:hypothetical protein